MSSQFRGSGSCSAVACHGSIAKQSGRDILKNEHTTWISDDPHSRAYQTLFGARSKQIARSLAAGQRPLKPAYEDDRCLACHTTPRSKAALAATPWMSPDGVGCESCHGASGRWLGPHTTVGWKDGKDSAAKQELGLLNTKDLVRRAEVCAGCHIGQRGQRDLIDRDVNHDLIAAGHPRLNFEFAAYLDKLPSHWIEKGVNADPGNRNKRAPEFSARAWALGQLVTAKTALELSRGRAADVATAEAPSAPLPLPGPSSARPPWPEFAEYGCFSCHHSLADEAWRRDRRAPGVALGAPAWGSWYLPMTAALLEHPAVGAGGESQDFQAVLQQLVKEMSRPIPDAAVVERLTDRGVKVLEGLIEALPTRPAASRLFDAAGVELLIVLFDRRESWDKVRSWDEATQCYLALVALGQAWAELAPARKADQDRLEARLMELRSKLTFPTGFDSPSGFHPGKLPPRRDH